MIDDKTNKIGINEQNSRKIWQKNQTGKLHPEVESFEVGTDYIYDGRLFKYEIAASHAHAKMLNKIGILDDAEMQSISKALKELYGKYGDFIELTVQDEDIHSKLENLLTQSLGETGKKIHTGRSRNDQIMVVMRLFEKENLLLTGLELISLLETIVDFCRREGEKILPGYTHSKQAMLINVKTWALAFIESGIDNLSVIKNTVELIDSNPLGTGSGFGVPIPLDRRMTADLLGFSRIQENPVSVENSRGKYEGIIIDAFWNIMNDFSRIAADMLLYNLDELLYMKTNQVITTGSSIMPQKTNLDVMELMRARTSIMLGYSNTVKNICSGILSGYNRDLQETKEPVFKAVALVQNSIKTLKIVFENIEFDEQAVKKNLSKGIFATDIAFEAVGRGMPFRDAYRLAANQIEGISINDKTIKDSLNNRVSQGSPVTIDLEKYEHHIAEEKEYMDKGYRFLTDKLNSLLL